MPKTCVELELCKEITKLKEHNALLLLVCKRSLQWHRGDKWRFGTEEEHSDWLKHEAELKQAIKYNRR